MKRISILAVAMAAAAALVAASLGASPVSATTYPQVAPIARPGNFVSSDDQQVCWDMAATGLIGEFTEDASGFKIDPPTSYDDGFVKVTLSADGRYLAWEADAGVQMIGVIVKGGPNYNVYNYVGTGFDHDKQLQSPVAKGKIPQISHYNICYIKPLGGSGCTRGYWVNHADRWSGVAAGDDFDATFGVDAFNPNITLGQAIQLNGGGINQLAAQATAALLNSYGGTVADPSQGTAVQYPLTTAEVIALVQGAIADPTTMDAVKDVLDGYNNGGCTLTGTRAVKV
jgi:hypothetical protein